MKAATDIYSELDISYIKEILSYNKKTGSFTWKVKRRYGIEAGSVAGTSMLNGYRLIGIDGRQYLAHRLAWLISYGEWPRVCVDHINGDPSDNRLGNLREATVQQNHQNTKLVKTNTSGKSGVWLDKRRGRWNAEIMVMQKKIFIGSSPDFLCAVEMRNKAEKKYFGEFRRLV